MLNDASVAWREAGDGNALVLLHGIGSSSISWQPQLSAFADRFRVIAWDAPGYGGSDPLPMHSQDGDDYAARLKGLIDHIGISRAVFVGHSLGALILAAFTRAYANVVTAVVFADPALGYGADRPDLREQKLADRIALFELLGPTALAKERGPKLLSPNAPREAVEAVCSVMAAVRAEGYLPAARLLANGDMFRYVADLRIPTLVLCGEYDAITPPENARRLAAAIPGAVYQIVPGAGHASYVERPVQFNELLGEFLACIRAGD